MKTVLFQDKAQGLNQGRMMAEVGVDGGAAGSGAAATGDLPSHSQQRAVLEAAVTSSIAHPNGE